MNLRLSRNRIKEFVSVNYFWIMIVGYILAFLTGSFSVVVLSSILFFILLAVSLTCTVNVDVVGIYVSYLLLSVVCYAFNGRSFTIYMHAVAYMILPMIMYFIPKNNGEQFIKKSMEAIFFSLIIAVILYVWPSQYYAEYLYSRSLIGNNDIRWIRPSLIQGLYGLTTVSNFAVCCSFYYYVQTSKTRNRNDIIKFFICVAIALYARRRAAIAGLIMGLIIANIIVMRQGKISKSQSLINLLVLFFVGIALAIFGSQVMTLIEKVLSVRNAVSERSGNWHDNLDTIGNDIFFGRGLGSYGHIAGSMGFSGVFDSQYVLMVMENGIIGVVLFTASVFCALLNSIRHKCVKMVPLLIVVLFLIQCIGSNVLEMPLPAAIFWYSLSYMQQENKREMALNDVFVG